jgi:hypothetical protein
MKKYGLPGPKPFPGVNGMELSVVLNTCGPAEIRGTDIIEQVAFGQ